MNALRAASLLAFAAAALARADYLTFATGGVAINTSGYTDKFAGDYGAKPTSAIDVALTQDYSAGPYTSTSSGSLHVLTEMGRVHGKADVYATQHTTNAGQDGGNALVEPNQKDFFAGGGPFGETPFVGGEWRDVIHVRSATLPVGTLVQFRLRETLDGSLSSVNPYAFSTPTAVLDTLFGTGYSTDTLRLTGGAQSLSTEVLAQARVGDDVSLMGRMSFTAQTSVTYGYAGASSVDIDASNTGVASLQVLTPGATFTTDSGYLYAPVPEPSALAALGLGAAAMLRRRKRA